MSRPPVKSDRPTVGKCIDCTAGSHRSANHPGPRCSTHHRAHECAEGRHSPSCPKPCTVAKGRR